MKQPDTRPQFLIEKEKSVKVEKAAPLMLEALKKIVKMYPTLPGKGFHFELLSIAQAAINAAEGKGEND